MNPHFHLSVREVKWPTTFDSVKYGRGVKGFLCFITLHFIAFSDSTATSIMYRFHAEISAHG